MARTARRRVNAVTGPTATVWTGRVYVWRGSSVPTVSRYVPRDATAYCAPSPVPVRCATVYTASVGSVRLGIMVPFVIKVSTFTFIAIFSYIFLQL